jgi:hypothetical protein
MVERLLRSGAPLRSLDLQMFKKPLMRAGMTKILNDRFGALALQTDDGLRLLYLQTGHRRSLFLAAWIDRQWPIVKIHARRLLGRLLLPTD